MTSIVDAIEGRRSIRAFKPDPVPRETVERILEIAARAPSGANIQPWKVKVLTGAARDALCQALLERHQGGDEGDWEYKYYPMKWRDPYLARRRENGWGLYGLLGIEKGDRAATRRQHGRNFLFFDAPVGLIITIDRDMELGSWLDTGMFIQNVMLTARAFGLETCPQAAFCQYHAVIQEMLAIPAGEMIVCGIALGHADPEARVNTFHTPRVGLAEFATFLDQLPPPAARDETP